jgi:hypothetical protein
MSTFLDSVYINVPNFHCAGKAVFMDVLFVVSLSVRHLEGAMEVIPRGLELNFGNYLPRQSHIQIYNNIYIISYEYVYVIFNIL